MKPEEIQEAAKEAEMTIFVMESLQRYTNIIEKIIEKRTIEQCAQAAIEACTSDLTDAEVIAAIRKLGEQ